MNDQQGLEPRGQGSLELSEWGDWVEDGVFH